MKNNKNTDESSKKEIEYTLREDDEQYNIDNQSSNKNSKKDSSSNKNNQKSSKEDLNNQDNNENEDDM